MDKIIIKPSQAAMHQLGSEAEYDYLELLQNTMDKGRARADRTGVGTFGSFIATIKIDLSSGFPLLTTKHVPFKSVLTELLWFLRGDTNTAFLKEHGCRIWDANARADGEVGPMYGKQWTDWVAPDGTHVNQIANLVEGLRNDPMSRRHVVSAWNAGELKDMVLAPCHGFMQFYSGAPTETSGGKRTLSMSMYQRSCDLFLGVPFNIASYAMLLGMVAQQTNHHPETVHWIGGDVHVYSNHLDQANEQIDRDPQVFPSLEITPAADIFSYTHEHFALSRYTPAPAIKAAMAV